MPVISRRSLLGAAVAAPVAAVIPATPPALDWREATRIDKIDLRPGAVNYVSGEITAQLVMDSMIYGSAVFSMDGKGRVKRIPFDQWPHFS